MRPVIVAFVVLGASVALAQDKLCNAATESSIDRADGIIAEKVTLSGSWGSNSATFLKPDKDIVQGVVVFSHSEILPDGRPAVSLLPLAMTLARAGAAVIIPERTLNWLPQDKSMNREGEVVVCAWDWIVEHTKVVNQGKPILNDQGYLVRWGYAYLGPRLCAPHVSGCHLMSPENYEPQPHSAHDREGVWVPVGETEGHDGTTQIISNGGLGSAKFLQQTLGLAPIQSIVSPGGSSAAPNH